MIMQSRFHWLRHAENPQGHAGKSRFRASPTAARHRTQLPCSAGRNCPAAPNTTGRQRRTQLPRNKCTESRSFVHLLRGSWEAWEGEV